MTDILLELPDAAALAVILIEITNSVTQGAETIEIFTELAEKCGNLLPVAAAGILLRDVSGTLQVIGASSPSAHLLNLFAREPLSADRLVIAQALADTATLSLLQVDPHIDLQIVIRRIHLAVESRNTLEQAQGMIAQRFGIDTEEALIRLRDVCERTGLSLVEAATAVVQRDPDSPVILLLANG